MEAGPSDKVVGSEGLKDAARQEHWDVVVVGAGGSGLAAACTAASCGARVLVLEKQSQPGGTTGIAVGSFTAAETRLQRQQGVADSVEHHVLDAAQFAPEVHEQRNNHPLRQFFLQRAAETLTWLEGLGLSFVGPSPEPPNRQPRMHNVVPGAKAYIATLHMELLTQGGTLQCETAVEKLLTEEGRVVGVVARVENATREYRARHVILAAGDYAADAELIARYKGEGFRQIEGINPHAHGDGHRLVEQAGGVLLNMDITYGPELRFIASRRRPFQQWLPSRGIWSRVCGRLARYVPGFLMQRLIKRLLVTWQHPEDDLFLHGAILINQRGERFVDETRTSEREIAVAQQPGKLAYILMDQRCCRQFSQWPHFISTAPDIAYAYVQDYLKLRPDVAVRGDTLHSLAEARGLDAERLEQTWEQWNAIAAGTIADPFGRSAGENDEPERAVSAARASGLDNGPYVLLGPVKAWFTTTEGGAQVNEHCQVMNVSGDPIPGLYAVGQNGLGGMVLWGHGLHIAWAMTSGRIAGHHAAHESNHGDSGGNGV